ncbi:OLC1v1018582C1 [Oldenlandia corymbosa var. corymbosa]|uniref:OLC1v1018582C1 n=1 Tax=Oldenlandia corymbosa var. corymbosa TaxID=529605 RepID=A0AAV1ECC2_OLDCO|nr:OLC1v1018582C1 [Oldenlandia corymbosa var. corymbosa]
MAETNQTRITIVEPSVVVEDVNENVVDNSVVIPFEDVISPPPNHGVYRVDRLKVTLAKASVTTNLFNGRIYLDDMAIPDIFEYKDRYTTYEDFINGAILLSLGDIDDLDEVGYVVIFENITGLAKEYDWLCIRLDVSKYNIRNSSNEIFVAKVIFETETIKKYINDVSKDQEIDPEMSAEFYQNVTPTQDSTTKGHFVKIKVIL